MLLRLMLLFIALPPSTLTTENNIPEGTVRLSEGKTPYEGRVEIFHSGIWGTICDDKWTAREAGVVCHMMGAMREGATMRAFSEFGNGIGSIWLDEVSCIGNESSIVDCSHTDWGISDCTHAEDVGVICVPSGETTVAPSTIATPPKFYIAPQENIVRWGHKFHLTCFTPSDDIALFQGQIVWCRNDIMFFNQSIDSRNSTGQWVYTAQHALSIHTATYTCGLDQCQRSLATVDVTGIPENECKLVQTQNPDCEIDKINEVEAEVDFLAKGIRDDVNVEHVLRTALPKIADVASEGISDAKSLGRTVDIVHKMATIADVSNVTIHPKVLKIFIYSLPK